MSVLIEQRPNETRVAACYRLAGLLLLEHQPDGHDQKKHGRRGSSSPDKGGGSGGGKKKPPKFKSAKLVRYVHNDGRGLLNNQSLDRMKLTEDEENELMDVMDFGLQQPARSTTGQFYFTPEGDRQHARMIELLTKASKSGVQKREVRYTGTPNWESFDGQVAIDPDDLESLEESYTEHQPDGHDQKKHGRRGSSCETNELPCFHATRHGIEDAATTYQTT